MLVESLEQGLEQVVVLTTFVLEAISVLCIVVGLLRTLHLWVQLRRQSRGREFPFNQVRLAFGSWLALALEFQLGADILGTTVAPTSQDLARLGLIAVIRTFLNYFLGKEMEMELALERERLAQENLRQG
ncbi:hypothetical protein GFS31_19890 [Leptolyngbya sp. BL0902]|uniref:DUF1622 domain-containing protein n=1 Tax=Leptolyngbya sp. BL0902 TaxID=1115757 RepID=UPI00193611A7|nr:DUF1622 domain-containing protein [Leptolyngbya sp. BL0902]QQE65303.1 hypothetical protein GFS31_19890 [Leptolyngbya sp. BL0902]